MIAKCRTSPVPIHRVLIHPDGVDLRVARGDTSSYPLSIQVYVFTASAGTSLSHIRRAWPRRPSASSSGQLHSHLEAGHAGVLRIDRAGERSQAVGDCVDPLLRKRGDEEIHQADPIEVAIGDAGDLI